jgi:transcriptional regulator with XRE-family HTH domain
MMNIRWALAENLKSYRYALGWSQAQLAERVNTSTNYIGMIEIGKKFPSPEMIEKLAAALGIDSTLLFSKEIGPSETLSSLKITALAEVGGLVGRFIDEKVKVLKGDAKDIKVKPLPKTVFADFGVLAAGLARTDIRVLKKANDEEPEKSN